MARDPGRRARMAGAYGGQAVESLVNDMAAIRLGLERIQLTHFEDRVAARSFADAQTLAVGPATTATLITMTPPPGMAWRLKEMGNTAGGNVWDGHLASTGLRFRVKRGGSPVLGLDNINFSLGQIYDRGDVYLSGNPQESLEVEVQNTHATDTITACAVVVGVFYSGEKGGA